MGILLKFIGNFKRKRVENLLVCRKKGIIIRLKLKIDYEVIIIVKVISLICLKCRYF